MKHEYGRTNYLLAKPTFYASCVKNIGQKFVFHAHFSAGLFITESWLNLEHESNMVHHAFSTMD